MTGVLLKAVSAGRPRQVRLLLDSGIHTEPLDECGQTPLIRAIFLENRRTRSKILRMLLKAGARVSRADVVGRNALIWGCIYARDKEVKWMLQCSDVDLDLNFPDYVGQTALFHAVTVGSASIVKLLVDALLKYRISIEIPDRRGMTPLMQGIRLGHDVCCSILIHQGGATAGRNMSYMSDVDLATTIRKKKFEKLDNRSDSPDMECEVLRIGKNFAAEQNPRRGFDYFPPIIPQPCAQIIRLREECAKRHYVQTNSGYFEDNESVCPSEDTNESEDHMLHYGVCLPELGTNLGWTVCSDPRTLDSLSVLMSQTATTTPRTASLTTSTEGNVESSDDEVDDRSRPIHESKQGYQVSRDLHRIFQMGEQQQSSSYRPGAARPTAARCRSDDSNADSASSVSSDSLEELPKAPKVKVKKPQTKGSIGGKNGRKLPTKPVSDGRYVEKHHSPDGALFCDDSDMNEKLFVPTKRNILPQIFTKDQHKQENIRPHVNYSNS